MAAFSVNGPEVAGRERGSVTAETAMALPVLVLLLGVCLATVGAVTAQLRCVDAAREAARASARGEPLARVQSLARQVAPAGARVEVVTAGPDTVKVVVSSRIPLAGHLVAPVVVRAQAVALVEAGEAP